MACNSTQLHIIKDGEEWKEVLVQKSADVKLRQKLKEIQGNHEEFVVGSNLLFMYHEQN